MKKDKQSIIEWYKDLYPHQQVFISGHTVAAALGAIIAYLLFIIIPDDFPIEPFLFIVFGLLLLYLNFHDWRDKWD